MPMSIEKAYSTLKDNPPMTNKVLGNPASPFQGVAQLAQQYQNQANVSPTPVPMQSVLQQQAQQPTTFAKGDKVTSKHKSPDHKIEQNIHSQFGPNVPANIKKILKEGTAYAMAHGRPDPGHLRKLLAAVAKLPPEVQAQYKPRIDAAKAALAKAKGVAGISKFAEGDEVEAKPDMKAEELAKSGGLDDLKIATDYLADMYAKPSLSPEMAQMMQIAQEGKMRQGLGSTIGAALTGAATPHALQAGQASAMMAGEAADKGLGALNAGQDAMMAKAAEIEGGPNAARNMALGQTWAALQKEKEAAAAEKIAGIKSDAQMEMLGYRLKKGEEAADKKYGRDLTKLEKQQAFKAEQTAMDRELKSKLKGMSVENVKNLKEESIARIAAEYAAKEAEKYANPNGALYDENWTQQDAFKKYADYIREYQNSLSPGSMLGYQNKSAPSQPSQNIISPYMNIR